MAELPRHLRDRNHPVSGYSSNGLKSRKKSLTSSLSLQGETTYSCVSTKNYTDSFTIEQEVSNSDSFITLASLSKDPSSASIHNAKAILVKNVSNVAAEVVILVKGFKNNGGASNTYDVQRDVTDVDTSGSSATNMWSFLLPANDFMYLPNSRIVEYHPFNMANFDAGTANLESAGKSGVGNVAIEPKDINSGNEYKKVSVISGTTYGGGSDVLIDGTVSDVTATAFTVDDGDWFREGDLLILGNTPDEVVEVISMSGTTVNIKRGLLGTTSNAITNNEEIGYFFGNEYLPYNNGKCMTDRQGKFKQRGAFFGYGRTADKIVNGLVPGSVAVGPFYTEGGYLDWGLQGITPHLETGLAASTEYTFHIVVDQFGVGGVDDSDVTSETLIAFTTSSDTTWAGSETAVLPKIQAIFDAQFYTTSSGLKNKKVTIGLHRGDVRVQSHSNHSETRVGIANVSGTTPFGVGNFPALSSSVPDLLGSEHGGGTTDNIVFGPASTLAKETIDDKETGKTETNINAFIFDNGKGDLTHLGQKVGWVDYNTGHCEWQVPSLPEAEFKVYAESHSAHRGGVSFVNNAENSIQSIRARSVNAKDDAKIQLIIFG